MLPRLLLVLLACKITAAKLDMIVMGRWFSKNRYVILMSTASEIFLGDFYLHHDGCVCNFRDGFTKKIT